MNDFYVYALLDPRYSGITEYEIDNYKIRFDFAPFYIGKGKKWRMNQHYSKYNLKKNTHKNNKILSIINGGDCPISLKIIENLEEEYAYDLEIKIISKIGLDNLTNKNEGGIGQSSNSMVGEKNPMFGKHPIPWNKNKTGCQKSPFKGMKIDDIFGEEKSVSIKKKQSDKRKGKSWEEYFGVEKALELKNKRSIQRIGTKHSELTKSKIKEKICTPDNILKRKKIILENRKKLFDFEFETNKENIKKMIDNGYADNEINKRISDISKYKIKKMIFLLKNNLNSDYYFKIL
jgi:hypothetical protein